MSVKYNDLEFEDKDDAIMFYYELINLKRPVERAIEVAFSEIFDQMKEHKVPKELADDVFDMVNNDLTIDNK